MKKTLTTTEAHFIKQLRAGKKAWKLGYAVYISDETEITKRTALKPNNVQKLIDNKIIEVVPGGRLQLMQKI